MGKVVVLGLDGATFKIVNPMLEQGRLPHLKKLLQKSAYGTLHSCIPPNTDPAWPVFFTGMNPGKLGFFFYMQDIGDNYYRERLFRGPIQEDMFTLVSEQGKNVVAFNIPISYPPKKVNGIYVTGLLTPPGTKFTYPEEIQQELGEDYRISIPDFKFLSDEEKVIQLKKEVNKKFDLALKFYKQYRPDLFVFVTMMTDLVHHFFWKFMDPHHPSYEESAYRDVIYDLYNLIDNKIGEFLEVLDKNTHLIIMSDHGADASYLDFNINRWLINQGFMQLHANAKKKTLRGVYKVLGLENQKIRSIAKKVFVRDSDRAKRISGNVQVGFRDIDWGKTKAFGMGSYGLFINLQGRDNEGAVTQDSYHQVREELIEALRGITHPQTGKKVINKIFKKEDIYHGRYMDKMPDIVFIAHQDFFVRDFFKDEEFTHSDFNAAHDSEGLFIVHGPEVHEGKVADGNLIDMTPTILHLLDCKIPQYYDGNVLKQIFVPESRLFKKKSLLQSDQEKKTEDVKKKVSELVKNIKL